MPEPLFPRYTWRNAWWTFVACLILGTTVVTVGRFVDEPIVILKQKVHIVAPSVMGGGRLFDRTQPFDGDVYDLLAQELRRAHRQRAVVENFSAAGVTLIKDGKLVQPPRRY